MEDGSDRQRRFWGPVLAMAGAHFLFVLLAILAIYLSIYFGPRYGGKAHGGSVATMGIHVLSGLCFPIFLVAPKVGEFWAMVLVPFNSLLYGAVFWRVIQWLRGRREAAPDTEIVDPKGLADEQAREPSP